MAPFRRLRRCLSVLVMSLLLVAAGGACSLADNETEVGTQAPPAQGSGSEASARDWAAEGDRLRQAKREARHPQNDGGGHRSVVNGDDFAFQSRPVDIVGPGTYQLVWQDLPPSFNPPVSPAGFSINYPPNTQFSVTLGNISVDRVGEGVRIVQAVEVTNFKAPYPQFTLWLY